MRLGRRIDDLIDGLHGKVHGHELDDGTKPSESSANTDASKAHLGDGGVDDAAITVLFPDALGNLVRSVELRDLLSDQEHALVMSELLIESHPQSVTNSDIDLSSNGGTAREQSCTKGKRSTESQTNRSTNVGKHLFSLSISLLLLSFFSFF